MRKSRAVDFAMMLDSFIPELVRAARNQESRRLSRYSLTLPQFFALSCLEEGPRMMKELGEDLGLTLGTVTGITAMHAVIRMSEISDGTSNTFLIGEKYINPDFYYNGRSPADDGCPWRLSLPCRRLEEPA